MRRVILTIGLLILLFNFANLSFAATTQVDALIEKLVEKGILDRQEAIALKAEVIEDEKVVRQEALKESLPKWIQNTKLKGDFRLRYQYEKRNGDVTARNRARYRYRLGIISKIVDPIEVGFGLASGGDDPRSTNQTFQDTFSSKSVRIDYAYAAWMPIKYATIIGGKMQNPIYTTSDLLWDGDITPEGVAGKVNYPVLPDLNLFMNTGFFVIDEISGRSSDPVMFMVQPGFDWKITENVNWKTALASYIFANVKGHTLDWSAGTNTRRNGTLKYDYYPLTLSTKLGISNPLDDMNIPYIDIPYLGGFAEFVVNPAVDNGNFGFLCGGQLGHAKVSKKGQWAVKGLYRYLQRDAWLDTFPDSDAYSGSTDIHGPEVIAEYALLDNWILAFDYYWTERLSNPGHPENLFQVDLNYKF